MTPDWRIERDAALLRLEHEKNAVIRAEAAEALCELAAEGGDALKPEFAPSVVRLLNDAQAEVRCAGLALAALVLAPEEAKEILVRALGDPSGRTRLEAVGRLADLALPDSRGIFAQALNDDSRLVRFEAARGMAALKHSAGLEVLVEALDDDELRFRAAAALAELGNPEAAPALKRQLDRWMMGAFDRTQIAAALAKLGDPAGAEHLFKRAARKWSTDRAMAVELLGEVKAPGAREKLEAMLADPKDSCRGASARGLGRLGDAAAIPALEKALIDPRGDDDFRLDVAEGLCRLGDPRARASAEQAQLQSDEAKAELRSMLSELKVAP
ncbi:MAG: HEAT repeat domain-containing protein [Myxococcaceae bacterium]